MALHTGSRVEHVIVNETVERRSHLAVLGRVVFIAHVRIATAVLLCVALLEVEDGE